MARGRMLNKSISYNRDVATLTNKLGGLAGLVWTWMIAHLDREGRMHGDPAVIKGTVAPRIDGITPDLIRQMLAEANELGLIVWYEADGERYVAFPGFDHQQVGLRKEREPESDLPSPISPGPALTRIADPADCRQTAVNDPPEGNGREGKGMEGKYAPRSSTATPAAGSASPSGTPAGQAAICIPLVTGDEYPITEATVAEWSGAYPALDVMQELRKIRQWNLSNPRNQKTKRGVRGHITGWLAREQDSARPLLAPGQRTLPAAATPHPAKTGALAKIPPESERHVTDAKAGIAVVMEALAGKMAMT